MIQKQKKQRKRTHLVVVTVSALLDSSNKKISRQLETMFVKYPILPAAVELS